MKKNRKTLLIISIIAMIVIWGFIALEKETNLFQGLDLFVFILIVIFGGLAIYLAIKKNKEIDEGFPPEDELSLRIKYKAGYYTYLVSMYMWLLIFMFKRYFPDVETIIGGGILLSALLSVIIKFVVKNKINETTNN